MVIHVKTASGFECDFDKEALNDIEALELASAISKGDVTAYPDFIGKLFTPVEKRRLYDHVRLENGRVPVDAVTALVDEIVLALPDAEKK